MQKNTHAALTRTNSSPRIKQYKLQIHLLSKQLSLLLVLETVPLGLGMAMTHVWMISIIFQQLDAFSFLASQRIRRIMHIW